MERADVGVVQLRVSLGLAPIGVTISYGPSRVPVLGDLVLQEALGRLQRHERLRLVRRERSFNPE